MRFTEHEMTVALTAVAKHQVTAAQDIDPTVPGNVDRVWNGMTPFQRFQVLDLYGDALLPVLVALPDIVVEPGMRPQFSDAEVRGTVLQVCQTRAETGKGIPSDDVEGYATALAALTGLALTHVPVRLDPAGVLSEDLTVPDSPEGL